MRLPNYSRSELYKKQAGVSFISFLAEATNLVFTIIITIISNELVLWVDMMACIQSTAHVAIVFLVAYKMSKETGDRYNFGFERLEVFVSFISNVLVVAGMLLIGVGAVYNLFHPTPSDGSILSFCILKLGNITFDVYILIRERNIHKKQSTRITETEYKVYWYALCSDVLVGVVVAVCYFFRGQEWAMYVSPIFSLLMMIYLVIFFGREIREAIAELVDISIPISAQDELYDIVLEESHAIVKRIDAVNCRMLSRKLYVDICVQFKEDVTAPEQLAYLDAIKRRIHETRENAEIRLVVGHKPFL